MSFVGDFDRRLIIRAICVITITEKTEIYLCFEEKVKEIGTFPNLQAFPPNHVVIFSLFGCPGQKLRDLKLMS